MVRAFVSVFWIAVSCRAQEPPTLRLPQTVVPERYRLHLQVLPDTETTSGRVDIDLRVKEPASVLWLNASELRITEAWITSGGERIAARVLPVQRDYTGFALAQTLEPGAAQLHVAFAGVISRRETNGLFQMKDNALWYAYTQFEPTYARKVFPHFDEPSYKTPWTVTLEVRQDHLAFSNAPIVQETPSAAGRKLVTFAETKPLPSYLLAFAVGPFDVVDGGKAGRKNTPFRIIVPQGRAAEAGYALETTPRILALLEDYFGDAYPYEKLDQVAIPVVGFAMEHPGLVTYGQQLILAKPEADTVQRRRNYTSVCAHELAHQWFGNLVTMHWWDDTWLNEGFASWMAGVIVDRFQPEWETKVSGNRGALSQDSLLSARQVRQPIASHHDIANAFDGITYSKGAALLAMFESFLGPQEFQKGIRRYLNKYAWRTATSEDFLVALGGESGAVVSRSFSSFLDQPGAPLVTVELHCERGAARLTLQQERYLPEGSNTPAEQSWRIPVCVKYGNEKSRSRECMLLTGPSAEMPLKKIAGCPTWIVANTNGEGYYRVRYKGDLLAAALRQDRTVLNPAERVALIGDIAAFSKGGLMPMAETLRLLPALLRDGHRLVITAAMGITSGLQSDFVPPDLLPVYRRFLADSYAARARELGWRRKPGEDENTRLLRPSLMNVAANGAEDPALIEEARKLALAWLDDRKAVDADLVGTVLTVAARHGDQTVYDRFRAEAHKTKEPRERQMLLSAMGAFRDPALIAANQQIVLSGEFDIREATGLLFSGMGDPKTRDLAYRFVKDRFDQIVARLPVEYAPYLSMSATGYCDLERRADAETFFKDRVANLPGGPRMLAQALERIGQCAAAKAKQQPGLIAFLRDYGARQ